MATDGDGGPRPRRAGPPLRSLLAFGTVAVAIRVAHLLTLGRTVELGISDATFYSGSANLLAEGHGYVDSWRALLGSGLERTAHHPPGWPVLLSVASRVGVDTELGHRLVGTVVGGVVVVLLGLLAWRVAGRTAALVAAALAAVHPTLVTADGSLMAETLAGALVVLVVLLGLRVLDRPSPTGALAVGAAIGAGALVRGEVLAMVAFVGLPLAAVAARRAPAAVPAVLRVGLPVLVGVVAVVAPWTVRNTLLFDEVVLLSTNDATVLAGANCDQTYRGAGAGSWYLGCIRAVEGTEIENAAVWREDGLRHLREHRDELPAVVLARLARTLGVRDVLTPQAEGRHLGTQTVGNVVWLVLLAPGALLGAAVLVRRRCTAELGLLLAPVAVALVVTVLGFGMLRFRHPMELAAVVLAAVAAAAILDGRRAAGDHGADCAPLTTCPHSEPGR